MMIYLVHVQDEGGRSTEPFKTKSKAVAKACYYAYTASLRDVANARHRMAVFRDRALAGDFDIAWKAWLDIGSNVVSIQEVEVRTESVKSSRDAIAAVAIAMNSLRKRP